MRRILFATVVALSAVGRVEAGILLERTPGTEVGTFFPGQSFTLPGNLGQPFHDIRFNFFGPAPGLQPAAAGTLFLFESRYGGTPNDLSASTPGVIAQSSGVSGGEYVFDPGLVLLGGYEYFAYSNAALTISFEDPGTYGAEDLFRAASGTSDFERGFGAGPQDANFRLSGVAAVPEPATVVPALIAAATAALIARRRRAASS